MPPFALAVEIEPMEAKLVAALPDGDGWQFEPKWDGFRCLAFKAGADVELRAKSGKSLTRYFPEMARHLRAAAPDRFVLDGELVIPRGDSLSFGALQDRLHPAQSRVDRLAAETPALLIVFDCLAANGAGPLLDRALADRREALETVACGFTATDRVRVSPFTLEREEATTWLGNARGALDGIVCKDRGQPYAQGGRAMLKVKQIRTADCVVGGFRYAKGSDLVGSLLLGLYDEAGRLDHVGFTSAISHAKRPALTQRLRDLEGGSGFTGKAPGGQSRWSTAESARWQALRPELVVEVAYDQVTDGRFRHGTALRRWRPDKAPRQCTREQLAEALRPDVLFGAGIVRGSGFAAKR